jgi:NAD(P)-dependent dehydrogenase (short-subunit alcohol dehydrogenase family)
METARPLTIIAGLGPGLGCALARKFTGEGHDVVGLARSPVEPMEHLYTIPTDVSDERQVKKAFALIDERYPCPPSVLIHNTAELIINPFLQTSPASFEKVWKSMTLSAAMTSAECLKRMLKQGDGTMIFSGATAGSKGRRTFLCLRICQVRPEGSGAVDGQGVSAAGDSYRPCHYRWHHLDVSQPGTL